MHGIARTTLMAGLRFFCVAGVLANDAGEASGTPRDRLPPEVEEIVLAVRGLGPDGHWYANFGEYAPEGLRSKPTYPSGSQLRAVNLRTGAVRTLLADPKGGIRDPQVDYDAERIVFSYRPGGRKHYHLYEIGVDGSDLRQLTDGPWDDIEPSYLPDGDLIFVSSRCKRWVNCWLTPVAVLYRRHRDGSGIRQISSNIEHDNTPWPLPDGRVLYTRWEYVDRSQVHYHHLWTANPDGTAQMVYYGNLHPGIVMIDAKPVPDSEQVVAIFSPGHGRKEHMGKVTLVSPKSGPDARPAARDLTKGGNYRDPWAFSGNCFMAARDASLVLFDAEGREEALYTLPPEETRKGWWCHEPRPLTPRPREVILAGRVDPEQTTGRMLLMDVHAGRNMQGVKPGEIRDLLVLETLPKPINYTGGMEPLSYGGTFTLERILGTVPVERDGSAYFEAPAMRSVFFVARDENERAVKRMQSFTGVQPGETLGCVGCHEHRTSSPPAFDKALPLAVQRPPNVIKPVPGVPDVIDFPRDIQPILDRHCVECHHVGRAEGGAILTGGRGPLYSHSYFTLTVMHQLADGRNLPRSNYPPRALGSGAAPLLDKLHKGHHEVAVPPRERRLVRLWLDSGAAYPGTYAALGSGMIGGYEMNKQVINHDRNTPEARAAAAVIGRRCASCHDPMKKPLPRSLSDEIGFSFWQPNLGDRRIRRNRHIVFNLTRPEKSLILLAPLARSAGGRGVCRPKDAGDGDEHDPVFADTGDPGYEALLALCRAGKRTLDDHPRFDMPGFRPRPEWVREMKDFGILPAGFDPRRTPVDVYEIERQYWKSLHYQPRK